MQSGDPAILRPGSRAGRRRGSSADVPARPADSFASPSHRRSARFDLERHHVARLPAELHRHEVDRLARAAVLVRVAPRLQLRHGRPFAGHLHHLELEGYTLALKRTAMSRRPWLVLSSTVMSSPSAAK